MTHLKCGAIWRLEFWDYGGPKFKIMYQTRTNIRSVYSLQRSLILPVTTCNQDSVSFNQVPEFLHWLSTSLVNFATNPSRIENRLPSCLKKISGLIFSFFFFFMVVMVTKCHQIFINLLRFEPTLGKFYLSLFLLYPPVAVIVPVIVFVPRVVKRKTFNQKEIEKNLPKLSQEEKISCGFFLSP